MLAGEERVRPEAHAAHRPQFVVLRGVFADPAIDEAVVELVEGQLQMPWRVGAGLAGEPDAPVRMLPLEMHGIDGVFLDLEPVAGDVGEDHLGEAVFPGERLPVWQQRRRFGAEIGPDDARACLHPVRFDPDLVTEPRFRGGDVLVWLGEASALGAEQPAVIGAAQAFRLDHAVHEIGAAMRALAVEQAKPALEVAIEDEILAEHPDGAGRLVVEFAERGDRHPVTPEQPPHRRARPDLRQQTVAILAEHSSPPPLCGCSGVLVVYSWIHSGQDLVVMADLRLRTDQLVDPSKRVADLVALAMAQRPLACSRSAQSWHTIGPAG